MYVKENPGRNKNSTFCNINKPQIIKQARTLSTTETKRENLQIERKQIYKELKGKGNSMEIELFFRLLNSNN